MKTEILINKHDLKSEKTVNASFAKGHLNGLIIGLSNFGDKFDFADISKMKTRVKFVSDKVTHLVTEMPFSAILALSNLDFGSTNYLGKIISAGDLTLQNPDGTGQYPKVGVGKDAPSSMSESDKYLMTYPVKDSGVMAYLDLGSIYCESGDEVHISFELPSEVTLSYPLNLSLFSVSREIEPFHFLKYDIDFDSNELHQQVIRSFIYQREKISGGQIYVSSERDTYQTNFDGLVYLNGIFGKVENVNTGVLLECYRTKTGVPEDVHIKYYTDTATEKPVGILNVRVEFDIDRVTRKNVDELKELAEQVRKFEQKHPEQASAMIAAGMLKPSVEIENEAIRKL